MPAPPAKASVIDELLTGWSPTALWARVAPNNVGAPDPVNTPLIVSGPVIVPPVIGNPTVDGSKAASCASTYCLGAACNAVVGFAANDSGPLRVPPSNGSAVVT